MKKMTVFLAAYNSASAEKVVKKAKEMLGLKKGSRVYSANGAKVLFLSRLVQKSVKELSELDKYKDYDMLVLPSLPEDVEARPDAYSVKVYVNNQLGYSVFVCGIQKAGLEKDINDSAGFLTEIIKTNIGA